MRQKGETVKEESHSRKAFHIEFLNSAQKIAWMACSKHDVVFLLGPAGTAKTFLATAFAISEILSKKKKKLAITRPVVEAGEKLGALPGDISQKMNPYLLPIYFIINDIIGDNSLERVRVDKVLEISPIAYLRGRTFNDSIVILDEAQNATEDQLKLVMTRLGSNSKMIITGDPTQSDLKKELFALSKVVEGLKTVRGIAMVEFNETHIVRHPLVAEILKAWPK